MTEPGRAPDLDETVLDEGRVRRFASRRHAKLAVTMLDEGRQRPDVNPAAPVDWPDDGTLPQPLAERYELIRRLDVSASQAELFLVRTRTDTRDAVLKRYRTARPHPDLVSYLSSPRDHTVRYLEFGPGYEVMEHLPGGSLLQRREANPSGFDVAELHAIVQQVSASLIGLHRRGLVHRDVKPANVVLRSTEQLDVALVDFGIAGPVGESVRTEELNPAYQPPESVLRGRVTVAADWWGLGMTILELAAGEHPFDGLDLEGIADHFGSSRIVDVSGVPDDRVRSLCQGLLCADHAQRWRAEQVGTWLVGRDPELPSVASRPGSAPSTDPPTRAVDRAATAYQFNSVPYHFRDEVAQAMTTTWNRTVDVLFAGEDKLDELRTWLDQFTDDGAVEARRVVDAVRREIHQPGHVRLLRVVRALDPTRPAIFRHHIISRRKLRVIAHRALQNDGDAVSVLLDLWNHRLLPTLDTDLAPDEEAGGQALAELDRDWRAERRRWPALPRAVGDGQAREHLERSTPASDVLAVCLRAALAQPDDVTAAHEIVRQAAAELPAPMPWFSEFTNRPELVWVAVLLVGHARSRARSVADQITASRDHAETLRMSARFREWSRRQNRPVALGWAVAGVCLMAVVWIALVTASDAAGWAGNRAVGLAWVGASVCLGISLVAECLLAAEVGGRFHTRYSIPGAGAIAMRPPGRWMQRSSGLAAGVILAVLFATTLAALNFPQAIAVGTTLGHLLWVVRRWRAWRAQLAAEDALVAEAEQGRPSDMDGVPIGAM
jgi:hypothetical protein